LAILQQPQCCQRPLLLPLLLFLLLVLLLMLAAQLDWETAAALHGLLLLLLPGALLGDRNFQMCMVTSPSSDR
jgi:hypothetical protein